MSRKYNKTGITDKARYFKDYYRIKRREALSALGNKCTKCGFNDERALQIDHKNGGGGKEIRALGAYRVYLMAIENKDKYQILCANCNWIKRWDENEQPRARVRNFG